MNKVCSAGTGSFIQEQAVRLGIDLSQEFAALALNAQNPLPFTSRCTVFMGSDLVHYVQHVAAMINCNFEGIDIVTLPLVPGLAAKAKQRLAEKTAAIFALDKKDVLLAYDAADEEFALSRQKILYEDASQLRRARPLAVLLGKPYTRNRVEAFVHRVKRSREKRLS